MADRQWYTAIDGQQAGPYSDQRLSELVAAGTVRADTFVWCAGMTDWATAAEIPGLMPRARPTPPPPPRQPPQAARPTGPSQSARAAAPRQGAARSFAAPNFNKAEATQSFGQAFSPQVASDAERLITHVQMWPLLGRSLLVALGQITVIPSPWLTTAFYKWFIENIELPGQRRTGFTGQPMDIWYIFMLNAGLPYIKYILTYLGIYIPLLWDIATYLGWLTWPLSVFFLFIILKWVVRNTVWEGQSGPLTFTGSFWGVLGWYVLTAISFITIVGWAWVGAAWTRWMCRHLEGGNRQLVFTAGGWDLLWRTVVFALSCSVIIPIPWTLHWITRWYISQFALTNEPMERAAAA